MTAGAGKKKPVTRTIQVKRGKPTSKPRLSKSRGDRLRWKNNDKLRQRIVLSKWPFEGRRKKIAVAGGKTSVALTVRASAKNGKVRYAIVTKEVFPKRRKRASKAPDPPGFSVGG